MGDVYGRKKKKKKKRMRKQVEGTCRCESMMPKEPCDVRLLLPIFH